MAPKTTNQFGIPGNVFRNMLQVATLEARDPAKGASPGTVASMINRYHSPSYGSNVNNWLIPGQYAVMEKPDFSRTDPSKAVSYYNSPAGQQELLKTGQALRGATDFRSTTYLKNTGNLFKYQDNLIPAMVGGTRKYLTPKELQSTGAKPDYSGNTFFNEIKRPAKKKWWEEATPQQRASESPVNSTDTIAQQIGAGNLFGANALGTTLTDELKDDLFAQLFESRTDPTAQLLPFLLGQNRAI